MADSKITALTALTAADPANDMIPIVDVSDTPPASGNTKRISINNILACSPSATLASATITGALGAAGLNVTGATIPANGVYLGSANNLSFSYASTLGMTLNSTGLGVGVASPAFKIDVSGSAGSGIRFTGNSVSSVMGETGGFGLLGTTTNHNLGLYTNGSVKATIDTSGNVGIGVGPSAIANVIRLEIGGALSTNLTLRSSSGNASARNWMVGSNVNAFGDFVIRQGNSQGAEPNSGTDRLVIDLNGNPIFTPSSTPATLTANGQLTVNATSNTNLRFSYRGSDGTTRVANITLA
jgi:hypothetical protein